MREDLIHLHSADGARARLHRHGGHLLSWIPAGETADHLYLSPLSTVAPGVAIRGGVPVIFPQFASEGPLPKHGFARTARWELIERNPAAATLRLSDSPETLAVWPAAFELQLRVEVGGARLKLALSVRNTGSEIFRFTAALHSYFAINEIGAVRLEGLSGCRYRDSANGNAPGLQGSGSLTIDGEFDRIYFDTPPTLNLCEGERRLRIGQAGFCDTVVWNPGASKAAALADLPAPDYRRFLCVEAAVIGRPVTLSPGTVWTGQQILQVA